MPVVSIHVAARAVSSTDEKLDHFAFAGREGECADAARLGIVSAVSVDGMRAVSQ